ncbi:MAG: hypothetical protein JO172_07730 [Hyphomicrobiales bacterium]|nr:hypothetical protein [Hyphomicrobiales bacterium]
MSIELKGLEEWLRLGSIHTKRSETSISAEYKKPNDLTYSIHGGNVSVHHYIVGPMQGSYTDSIVTLSQFAILSYELNEPLSPADMRTTFGHFQDLFVLLTDSEYNISWPTIQLNEGQAAHDYTMYFLRNKTEDEPPRHYECPTNFVLLKESFGNVIENWLTKREQFGPGFYLYLGVRRGMKLYAEHRFVNLVWGMEALHRRKAASESTAERHAGERVTKILAQVSPAKDRKWLRGRLKYAHEPPLEQRIFEVIMELPINLERHRLRTFSNKCANLRNQISHFGTITHDKDYQSFMIELSHFADALAALYHSLILHEIGVGANIINQWVFDSFQSFRNKVRLVQVGLLDEDVLKPVAG